jgi:hypothetical protein
MIEQLPDAGGAAVAAAWKVVQSNVRFENKQVRARLG